MKGGANMWGPYMWGGWWIFPVIGIIFIIIILFAISQFFGGRGGFCSGWKYDEIENLRKEVRELKDEVEKLKRKE